MNYCSLLWGPSYIFKSHKEKQISVCLASSHSAGLNSFITASMNSPPATLETETPNLYPIFSLVSSELSSHVLQTENSFVWWFNYVSGSLKEKNKES